MINYNVLKFAIPFGIWVASSAFNGYRSSTIVQSLQNATAEQLKYADELKLNPISNETHWNNKLQELNNGTSLFDSKMGMDFVSSIALATSHVTLGMLNTPIALLPFIPHTVSTAMLAYAESNRALQHHKVIENLWTPDCSTKAFKQTLKVASDTGKAMSAEKYADFVTKVFQVEDTTNLVQLATLGTGGYNAYRDIMAFDDDIPPPAAPYGNVAPKKIDTQHLIYPASVSPSSGTQAGNPSDMIATPGRSSSSASAPAPAPMPIAPHVEHNLFATAFNTLIASRDVKLVLSSVATLVVTQNIQWIGSTLYSAASSTAQWLMDSLASNRSIAAGEYVLARETVRKTIEIDLLRHQFEVCTTKNEDINAKWLDTYTTDSCNEGDIFKNVLMGKVDCKFTDPAVGG